MFGAKKVDGLATVVCSWLWPKIHSIQLNLSTNNILHDGQNGHFLDILIQNFTSNHCFPCDFLVFLTDHGFSFFFGFPFYRTPKKVILTTVFSGPDTKHEYKKQ